MPRERVLACGVRLLDLAFFRIGAEEYASENGSFGLATLRRSHVSLRNGRVGFDYPAKGGVRRILTLEDGDVADVVRRLKRRRGGGEELLAYRDGRRWVDVRSADVNAYIKAHAGGEYSAKDFRTWHGTVLAAVALASEPRPSSRTGQKRAIVRAIREVAEYLGNTPAVARSALRRSAGDRLLEERRTDAIERAGVETGPNGPPGGGAGRLSRRTRWPGTPRSRAGWRVQDG